MKRQGFTLIEMLAVITILGIVMAVAAPPYLRYLQSLTVQQAAQQFARDADQARSQAKQTNTCRVFSYVNATTYSVASYTTPNCSGTATTQVTTMPTTTVLTLRSTQASAMFVPPYGINSTGTPLDVTVASTAGTTTTAALRITGIMGSVVSQ